MLYIPIVILVSVVQWTAYSFATDEASFIDWSESYLGLKPIRRGHVSIQGIDALSGAATTIECEEGIEYNWVKEDRVGVFAPKNR